MTLVSTQPLTEINTRDIYLILTVAGV